MWNISHPVMISMRVTTKCLLPHLMAKVISNRETTNVELMLHCTDASHFRNSSDAEKKASL